MNLSKFLLYSNLFSFPPRSGIQRETGHLRFDFGHLHRALLSHHLRFRFAFPRAEVGHSAFRLPQRHERRQRQGRHSHA